MDASPNRTLSQTGLSGTTNVVDQHFIGYFFMPIHMRILSQVLHMLENRRHQIYFIQSSITDP
jgi:hypothetical protein